MKLYARWFAPLSAALLAPMLALTCGTAGAQAFPSRAVTMIVPVAPGGILDQSARMVAPAMGAALGQPVVIDNRPGASGNIGAVAVARAKPDGYTLLIGYSMFHVGNPAMFKDLQWDPLRDFTGVGMIAVAPHVITVNPAQAFQTLKELVDYARANPGKLNYSTSATARCRMSAWNCSSNSTRSRSPTCPTRAPARRRRTRLPASCK